MSILQTVTDGVKKLFGQVDEDQQKEQLEKDLIECAEELRKKAQEQHPTNDFKKYDRYYKGEFTENEKSNNLYNSYNIVKSIVETKTTYVLDSKPTTEIVPKILKMADLKQMKTLEDIADIYQACWENVQKVNKFSRFRQKAVRRGDIMGMGIAEITFDPEMSDGLGDISIKEINPLDFLWDQSANTVDSMNYCFIKRKMSPLTLKEKYAKAPDGSFDMEMIKKIDSLMATKPEELKDNTDKPTSISNSQNDFYTEQAFVYGSTKGIERAKEDITLWTMYFKDDAIFAPTTQNQKIDNKTKEKLAFKYPHGRMLVYSIAGNTKVLFEDKPIDYPFGIPISIFNPIDTDDLKGMGDVKDLCELQERINKSYLRLKTLVQRYVSLLAYDPLTTGLKPGDLVNSFTLAVENLSKYPDSIKTITNNTLAEIEGLLKMIQQMKQEAKELARVNDIMVSGERPQGVTSGEQIKELNLSPQTSIRAIQSNFTEFLIDITNKAIALIGLYYNTPRIIRLASGKFARMKSPMTDDKGAIIKDEEGTPTLGITIYNEANVAVQQIQGDLSIAEYECDVVYGTEIPRTKTEIAQLTVELAKNGVFGDPASIDVKERVLRELDYPGYRAIIDKMKSDEENAPTVAPPPPIKDIQTNFKDLPPVAQDALLKLFGIQVPAVPAVAAAPTVPVVPAVPAVPSQGGGVQ